MYLQKTSAAKQLTSLTSWSHEHILRIFESPSDALSTQAVEETFADDIVVEINGKMAGLAEVKRSVALLRKESPHGLKVEWKQTVEAPEDSSNRSGSFAGSYIVHGIRKMIPGHMQLGDFERHKNVIVRIQSQSENDAIDSRKITSLAFVAADIQVNMKGDEQLQFGQF